MSLWLLFAPAIVLALIVAWTWVRERRQPKDPGPSFRPWQVRLTPRRRK